MANWKNILSRGNVEDRRSLSGSAIGGIGLTGVAIMMLLSYATGGNPLDVLLQVDPQMLQQTQPVDTAQFEGEDTYEVFASTVLGSNNDMWVKQFASQNKTYSPPSLVLFRGSTSSACGGAASYIGPHYCPIDSTIYLDETFFDELTSRLGAEGGDVAEAYVIAHEVAHHAQNQLGIMDAVGLGSGRVDNDDSIKLELQADCFAGLWAYSIKELNVFGPGEIGEAMDAAAAVGDDSIQKQTSGSVNPESWTHGSSAERVQWFTAGYDNGNLESCDTFN